MRRRSSDRKKEKGWEEYFLRYKRGHATLRVKKSFTGGIKNMTWPIVNERGGQDHHLYFEGCTKKSQKKKEGIKYIQSP